MIATGDDREDALDRLSRGLKDLRVLGVTTNTGYLARLLGTPAVRAGDIDTGLLERGVAETLPAAQTAREAAVAAAAAETLELARRGDGGDPWDALPGFRITGEEGVEWRLEQVGADEPIAIRVFGPPDAARAQIGDDEVQMSASEAGDGRVRVALDGRTQMWDHAVLGADRWIAAGPDVFSFRLSELVVEGASVAADGLLEAPMPGCVLSVCVAAGDQVGEGDVLLVVESMKMELTLTAPHDATVHEVRVAAGDQVTQGQSLVELEEVGA
jgi:acetyl-CoA/propionyl-CoA carboxylase biotin carboxyl carrier protein